MDVARWLKRLFGRRDEDSQPWRRWSVARLEMVKQQIEAMDPKTVRTVESGVLVAEWLLNRYLPPDFDMTVGDYKRALDVLRLRIQNNVQNPPPPRKPPLRASDIGVSAGHLDRTIAYCEGLGMSWGLDRVGEHFRTLEAGRLNGSEEAYGVCPRNESCAAARAYVMAGRYRISDLLAAYDDPGGPFPVLPHPLCGKLNPVGQEITEPCRCLWQVLPKRVPGVDPAFAAYLDDLLSKYSRHPKAALSHDQCLRLLDSLVRQLIVETREHLTRARSKPVAPWGAPAHIDLSPENVARVLPMNRLRTLQREHGLSGLRRKVDVVQQLLGDPASRSALARILEEAAKEADERSRNATAGEVAYLEVRLAHLLAVSNGLGSQVASPKVVG